MRRAPMLFAIAAGWVVATAAAGIAMPVGVTAERTSGAYRIVLFVGPAEPFYTPAEIQQHPRSGMLRVGGAVPVNLNARPRPTHHLVVHVYARQDRRVVEHAHVHMTYQHLAASGAPVGPICAVPVVEMQAGGRGPESTHYGNNVVMNPGRYRVVVTVNEAEAAAFMIVVR